MTNLHKPVKRVSSGLVRESGKASEQPPASQLTKDCRKLIGGWDRCLDQRRVEELCDKLDASEANRKELLTTLKRYGHHDSPCAGILDLNDDAECTCGFEAAKKERE